MVELAFLGGKKAAPFCGRVDSMRPILIATFFPAWCWGGLVGLQIGFLISDLTLKAFFSFSIYLFNFAFHKK